MVTLNWQSKVLIAIVVAPLTFMIVDGTGPYVRLSGAILAYDPAECNMAPDENLGRVVPGSCVAVRWDIDEKWMPWTCVPATSKHVSRALEDVNGRHELPRTENIYGGNRRPWSNPLVRPWVLPEYSSPGDAIYSSTACFKCNPLQKLGVREPVCLSDPIIPFTIEKRS